MDDASSARVSEGIDPSNNEGTPSRENRHAAKTLSTRAKAIEISVAGEEEAVVVLELARSRGAAGVAHLWHLDGHTPVPRRECCLDGGRGSVCDLSEGEPPCVVYQRRRRERQGARTLRGCEQQQEQGS